MHYANGRAAKIGDLVRGKGYNIKHEIVGILTFANPSATACNCQVSTVAATSPLNQQKWRATAPTEGFFDGQLRAEPVTEYGQLDAFVAIDPATGEVLPAEAAPPEAA